jgi:hypothetical protein
VPNGHLFNYFNKDDFALAGWEKNNQLKPDTTSGYYYEDHDGDINSYKPDIINPFKGDWFHTRVSTLAFPQDTFEIFARCAQSRSYALGKEPNPVAGFVQRNLQEAPFFPFDGWHYSHSREFRSNIVKERSFWIQLGKDSSLIGFYNIQ